jgi:hypothetical protein
MMRRLSLQRPENKIVPQDFVPFSNCTKKLGSGTSGVVYRFCTDKECKHCFAAKYASFAKDEVHRLRLIEYATRTSPYRHHINRIVKAYPLNATDYLIVLEQLLPVQSSAPTFLQALKFMTVFDLKVCLIQLFATLAYLHTHVEDFVHMDLHLGNVYMIAWPFHTETLPTQIGPFVLPKTKFFPVLIDYGHSYTTSEPNAQLWGPGSEYAFCAHPKYDIYKLLALHLLPISTGETRAFLTRLISFCFDGLLPDALIERTTQTIYSTGCQRLPDVSYVDVLRFREFESFLK